MAAGYETAKAFAEANGIPQPTYALHESGERGLKMDVAERYATALRVDVNWLLTGAGNPPEERAVPAQPQEENADSSAGMIAIDELDMAAGAAAGGAISTYLENDGDDTFEMVHVRRRWVLPAEMAAPVTAASSDRLKIVPIVGNSMVPDFLPGQRVLVDTTDRVPSPPGVFLVWDGLNFVIKLVEYVPFSDPPKVRLKSKNPDYEPYERTLDEAYIQGRVIGGWQWT